ncbi:MAG: phosphate/phosphite/phosphonate ABC transporter substrate-binding protein [Chloroflexi bacterium]|uniref:Phosphate/phosphite/phosphonate ABC transporter substrate-binding protein n=1 Tax=Candidatus Chlorohelix allophototropha TaxID=3003348 RepID=A0A8T7M5F8_9CHLR|nr:phosphate/phosphite/phosphonate ABC transporter substrate-binding protein [Chloroflexota bacterium]WJW69133.1 phosphate/phosphite/phosphonate ABC transporter substrate-binding protein [Chloroflexota bacterium L227-S17]
MNKLYRVMSGLLVSLVLVVVLAACGDNTATSVPTTAATTAAATTAAATTVTATTAAATTAAATTAAATTAAATTAAATKTPAPTLIATIGASSSTAKVSLKALRLGAIPAENVQKVLSDTTPFATALSQQLGIQVELFVGPSYTSVIEALAANKLDVAIFGPFSYVLASSKYNAQVFALMLGTKGEKTYNSFIITTPKTGIKTLADLKGHSFSFVDVASASGNLVPRYSLITKAKLDPDKDVNGVFTGSHDASLLAVQSGKVDAGAVASDIFQKYIDNGTVKAEEIVIVDKSFDIPNSPVAYRNDLSDTDKAAIKNAFLSIKDTAALNSMGNGGFIEATESYWDPIRDIAKVLNVDLTKLK